MGVSDLIGLLGALCPRGAPGSRPVFRHVWRFFCGFASELNHIDITRTERR